MTTRPLSSITLVASLTTAILYTGCGHPAPPPRTTRIVTPAPVVVKVANEPQTVAVQKPQQPVRSVTPAPAPPRPAPQPPAPGDAPVQEAVPAPAGSGGVSLGSVEDTLSDPAAKVLKMYESGVGESVISSYAANAPDPFALTADQIIFLTDVGFADEVITAMIEHDKVLGVPVETRAPDPEPLAVGASKASAATDPTAPVYAQNPPSSTQTSAPPAAATTVIIKERPAVTTQVFYDSLSPYGTWIYLDDHGWTWQPTVATVNVNWRPYYDRGHWIYTDAGWYWQSGYSWGWAPFHYGRWTLSAGCGWVWVPGTVWGPSWVSWRYTDAYCGWAPLPPYAGYSVGLGFTYQGSRVGVGFGFGLGYSHFSFVSRRRFGRRGHYHDRDRIAETQQVYNDSTVVNNYIVGDNNTIINEGISRDRLTRGNRDEIKKVALNDVGNAGQAVDGGRSSNESEAIGVYRPRVQEGKRGPSERQLARQETRATRSRIESRSGRSLTQEPARRMTRDPRTGGKTLAATTATTSGRIAPNRSSGTAVKRSLPKQPTATSSSLAQGSRGTPRSTRTRQSTSPARPPRQAALKTTGASGSSRLTRLNQWSSNPAATQASRRDEIAANRAASTQTRIEAQKNRIPSRQDQPSPRNTTRRSSSDQSSKSASTTQPNRRNEIAANRAATRSGQVIRSRRTTVSGLSRPTPPRYRTSPRSRPTTSQPSVAKRSTPSLNPRSLQSPAPSTSTRGRVQSNPRTGTPNSSQAQTTWRPTRVTPSTTNSRQTLNRSPQALPPSRTLSPAPSYTRPPSSSVTPRSTTNRSSQRQSAPSFSRSNPGYQATRRSVPSQSKRSDWRPSRPSPSRSASSAQSRSYSAPSRSTPATRSRSYSAPSRSVSPSRSFSTGSSRLSPQRSRGVPSR